MRFLIGQATQAKPLHKISRLFLFLTLVRFNFTQNLPLLWPPSGLFINHHLMIRITVLITEADIGTLHVGTETSCPPAMKTAKWFYFLTLGVFILTIIVRLCFKIEDFLPSLLQVAQRTLV